jgi:hypothetical protein
MHPRRPLGDHSRLHATQGPLPPRRWAMPRASLNATGLNRLAPRLAPYRSTGLDRLAPRLAPFRSTGLDHLAPLRRTSLGLAALTAVAAVAVAGCGHQGAKAGSASHDTSVTKCGMSRTAANVPVRIEVTRGQVSCTDAMAVEHRYARAIAEGKEPGNGGGGPVTIAGWHCQGFPTPKVLKTGWASKCTRSGSEILAVLPPPSS